MPTVTRFSYDSAKFGSIPLEQAASIESVPVGATVVVRTLRMPCLLIFSISASQSYVCDSRGRS